MTTPSVEKENILKIVKPAVYAIRNATMINESLWLEFYPSFCPQLLFSLNNENSSEGKP